MFCVFCSHDTDVANSRPGRKTPSVWRRRHCNYCGAVFSTREKPDLELSLKVKKPTKPLEPFSEEKLFLSVYDCLSHHKNAYQASKSFVSTIIGRLLPAKSGLIESKEIAEATYQVIRRFDRPAAIYYKSRHPVS